MYDRRLYWRWNRISSLFLSSFLFDSWYEEKTDYYTSLDRLFWRTFVNLYLSKLRQVFTIDLLPSSWNRMSFLSKRLRLSSLFVMAVVISWNFKEFILILEKNIFHTPWIQSLYEIKYTEDHEECFTLLMVLRLLSTILLLSKSFISPKDISQLSDSRIAS